MGEFDDLDTSRMTPGARELFERGQGMKRAGESIESFGKASSDLGCAMTMGCTIPIIIIAVLLMLFIF